MLGVVVALAIVLHASRQSIWLRWPARRWVGWAIVGFVIAGPAALLLGPILAEPFFGPISLRGAHRGPGCRRSCSRSSNGVMEEVIYRGVLLGLVGPDHRDRPGPASGRRSSSGSPTPARTSWPSACR